MYKVKHYSVKASNILSISNRPEDWFSKKTFCEITSSTLLRNYSFTPVFINRFNEKYKYYKKIYIVFPPLKIALILFDKISFFSSKIINKFQPDFFPFRFFKISLKALNFFCLGWEIAYAVKVFIWCGSARYLLR